MQTRVNQEHGPNCGAVGETQATACSGRRSDGRGRPWRDTQAVLNGVLWFSRTGAPRQLSARPLSTLPNLPSSLSAVAARWHADPTIARAGRRLARGKLDLSETFIDASFSSAKKGALLSARLAEEKEIMAIADRHGLPVACCVTSASPRTKQTRRSDHRAALHASQPKTNDRRPRL